MAATVTLGPLVVPAAVVGIALALVLDAVAGEPPTRVHPVALFGRLVSPLDREWSRPRLVGLVAAAVAPLVFVAALVAPAWVALAVSPLAAGLLAGVCLFVTMSYRLLLVTGRDVIALTSSAPDQARAEIRALVGRDTDDLSPAQLRSGAVESLAENLADGLVAPLLGFLLGSLVSLPAAVAGAAWVKGVNTLDSMLGYRSKPVGWASARLDDLVMWVPARASALLLAAATRSPGALVAARSEAGEPSSPNSGWPMATLAAGLGVGLHKPGAYRLNDDHPLPDPTHADRAVRDVAVAGALAGLGTLVLAWLTTGGGG